MELKEILPETEIKRVLKERLQKYRKISTEREQHECDMLWGFLSLLSNEDLFILVNDLYISTDFNNSWCDLHKTMRNSDFFEAMYMSTSIAEEAEVSGTINSLFWDFLCLSDVPYNFFKKFIIYLSKEHGQ